MSDSQREMAGGLEKGFGASNVQEHQSPPFENSIPTKTTPRAFAATSLASWGNGEFRHVSIIYGTYIIIFLRFPSTQPVTAENMNYGASVFGAALLFAVVDWFVRGHKKSKGPTIRMAHK